MFANTFIYLPKLTAVSKSLRHRSNRLNSRFFCRQPAFAAVYGIQIAAEILPVKEIPYLPWEGTRG
jgi:hypothetical protein